MKKKVAVSIILCLSIVITTSVTQAYSEQTSENFFTKITKIVRSLFSLNSSDTEINEELEQDIANPTTERIEVKEKPNKTNYIVGDTLDTEGLVLIETNDNEVPSSGPLRIITQPEDQYIEYRDTATFTVEAIGGTNIQYQWHTIEGENDILIEGATGREHTTESMSADQDFLAYFYCVVTNDEGESITSNRVQVKAITSEIASGPLSILMQPKNQYIKYGETATFIAQAAGGTNIQYQWHTIEGETDKLIEGATEREYTTRSMSDDLDFLAYFYCVVTNDEGESITTDRVQAILKTTQEITTGYECTPTELNTAGTQTITVTYEGKTTTFDVKVEEVKLDSITVTAPDKKDYIVGDTLDTTGLKITAKYNNGTTQDITEGYTCTPTKLNTVGPQTITVTYEENNITKTDTFNVTVEELKLDSITVTAPDKKDYIVGDTLDTTGLVITATYNNGTTQNITEGYTCTPTKLDTAGTQTITVTYGEQTATFDVNVIKKTITVTSNVYNALNGYIARIQPDTTLASFKSKIIVTNAKSIKVYDKNKTAEITDTDLVTTGMKLVLDDELTYTLVVIGDVNGDGKADLNDIFGINKHRLNKVQLKDEYLIAGDVNQDNKVDLYDIFQINKYRLGKIDTL